MPQIENKAPASSHAAQTEQTTAGALTNNKMMERTYLAVPYEERDQAKELGAKFDRGTKSWFAPSEMIKDATKKWSVEGKAPRAKQDLDPQSEFSDWLRAKGMDLKGLAEMDGTWRRVAISGERKERFLSRLS